MKILNHCESTTYSVMLQKFFFIIFLCCVENFVAYLYFVRTNYIVIVCAVTFHRVSHHHPIHLCDSCNHHHHRHHRHSAHTPVSVVWPGFVIMAIGKRKDVSPNAELQTGSKQQNINASSSSSSETSLEKRLIYGSDSQMKQQPIPNDHSTTYNDDDMQFSPILDNRKDKRNLTTTIEKINNNCNDNNSNLSYASDTDVMSAQLALNELMDVNGTIKDGTKLRVIAALNTILALQKEVKDLRDKLSNYECQQSSSGATNNNNNMSNIAIFEQLKEMKKSIESINEKMTRSDVPPETVEYQRPESFATIVKKTTARNQLNLGSVVSIDGNENAENVRKEIAQRIVPTEHGIRIKETASLSNGKFALRFDSPESKKKFDDIATTTAGWKCEDERKRNPIVYLKGVRKDIQKRDLPGLITFFNIPIADHLEANQMDMDNAIEVCFERPNKNPQKFANFGIRVTPAIRDIIINRLQGRVNIDYNYVHAEDMNPLHRCYKCQGFNHHQNNCREDRPTCLHCGGDHYYEQCHLRNELPFCTNCFKNRITDVPSHRTTDTRCPVYQRMLKRVVNRIQYV